jgi:hypothetical protein
VILGRERVLFTRGSIVGPEFSQKLTREFPAACASIKGWGINIKTPQNTSPTVRIKHDVANRSKDVVNWAQPN